jgi:hypothetical protein
LGLPKLKFALDYGLDPNLEANPRLDGKSYQAKQITLLNYVLHGCVLERLQYQRALKLQQMDDIAYLRHRTDVGSLIGMLKLLLLKGADPNRIYEISYDRYQLISCSEAIPLKQVLKNRRPVIYLFNSQEKLVYTVFEGKGAPNTCGQFHQPLYGETSIAAFRTLSDSSGSRQSMNVQKINRHIICH